MSEPGPSAHFLLLRVEGTRGEARSVRVRVVPTLEAAVAVAAELVNQPEGTWKPGMVDGVWRETDRKGHGFVVHRIDDPADTPERRAGGSPARPGEPCRPAQPC